MSGMKFRPRFSLRMLLLAIALLSIPMAWVAYQLNWIRQRHEFREQKTHYVSRIEPDNTEAPWSLQIFGEGGEESIWIENESDRAQAAKLFPESQIIVRPFPTTPEWPVVG